MFRFASFLLLMALLVSSIGVSQEKGAPKKEDPSSKKDEKKEDKSEPKKEDVKAKGTLPANWGKLGLTDDQKQKVYRVQNKYNDEIDVLEAKIKELKDKMSKERFDILTAEQKKRLKELSEAKSGSGS
jgi:flagellar motility protein MotE (MotC chaperone)